MPSQYVTTAPSMVPSMIAPDIAAQQMQLQRRQQMIDMLKQQGATPIEQQTVTGAGPARVVPISAFQGLAKVLAAGMGGYMQHSQDDKNLAMAKQYQSRLASILADQDAPQPPGAMPQAQPTEPTPPTPPAMPMGQSGDPSQQNMPPVAAALMGGAPPQQAGAPSPIAAALVGQQPPPAMVAPQPPNQFGLRNIIKAQAIAQLGGEDAAKAYWADQARTEAQKNNTAYGIGSQDVHDAMMRENAAKGQQVIKSGSTVTRTNADGSITPQFTAPDQATGINTTWQNGQPQAAAIPGVLQLRGDLAAAEAAGKNQQTLTPTDQLPTDAQGRPIPQTIAQTITGVQPHDGLDVSKFSREKLIQLAKTDPEAFANGVANFHTSQAGVAPSPQGVGLALGQKEGAQAAQVELSKKFSDLTEASKSAQTTNAYLQSIKALADKSGAGAFSDKTQLVNNLLSYAGISDKATDDVTAKNLMDKYSNQITARLGGGANGSDARSAIISAAYPNSHMTPDAVKEAVDNLVGANDMTKAKSAILSPHANARDPVAYQQKEQLFDQNADPRIWQWRAIQDPVKKKAFAATIMQQDPAFPQKIKALESIGAFQ